MLIHIYRMHRGEEPPTKTARTRARSRGNLLAYVIQVYTRRKKSKLVLLLHFTQISAKVAIDMLIRQVHRPGALRQCLCEFSQGLPLAQASGAQHPWPGTRRHLYVLGLSDRRQASSLSLSRIVIEIEDDR